MGEEMHDRPFETDFSKIDQCRIGCVGAGLFVWHAKELEVDTDKGSSKALGVQGAPCVTGMIASIPASPAVANARCQFPAT